MAVRMIIVCCRVDPEVDFRRSILSPSSGLGLNGRMNILIMFWIDTHEWTNKLINEWLYKCRHSKNMFKNSFYFKRPMAFKKNVSANHCNASRGSETRDFISAINSSSCALQACLMLPASQSAFRLSPSWRAKESGHVDLKLVLRRYSLQLTKFLHEVVRHRTRETS